MNIFNVLSMGKSRLHETSMSAMLSYLLNPNQDHGLGYSFLKSFLELSNEKKIYCDYINKLENGELKFDIELEVSYYYPGESRNDIDIQIKIFNKKNEELHRIIIENKIKSGAANSVQLGKYYQAVLEDKKNDDPFELEKINLSVIFLTPDLNHKILEEEFNSLEIDQKAWVYWNSSNNDIDTVVKLIQSILDREQKAEISPINEYMRHTFKAFAYFVNQTFDKSSLKNRVGEDIGNIKDEKTINIEGKGYIITLRDSGQIQLLNQDGDKVQARSLLRKYLKENNIEENEKCPTTRCYGKQIFDYLNKT